MAHGELTQAQKDRIERNRKAALARRLTRCQTLICTGLLDPQGPLQIPPKPGINPNPFTLKPPSGAVTTLNPGDKPLFGTLTSDSTLPRESSSSNQIRSWMPSILDQQGKGIGSVDKPQAPSHPNLAVPPFLNPEPHPHSPDSEPANPAPPTAFPCKPDADNRVHGWHLPGSFRLQHAMPATNCSPSFTNSSQGIDRDAEAAVGEALFSDPPWNCHDERQSTAEIAPHPTGPPGGRIPLSPSRQPPAMVHHQAARVLEAQGSGPGFQPGEKTGIGLPGGAHRHGAQCGVPSLDGAQGSEASAADQLLSGSQTGPGGKASETDRPADTLGSICFFQPMEPPESLNGQHPEAARETSSQNAFSPAEVECRPPGGARQVPEGLNPEPQAGPRCEGEVDPRSQSGRALGLAWPPRQLFDYFVVIDFEATCDNRKALHPQEIIEFPSVLVNAHTLQIEDSWRVFVRPQVNFKLTPFCMQLTGIQQAQVDGGVPLQEALSQHDTWLQEKGLLASGVQLAVVTWSDWDCKVMLEMECKWKHIRKPTYFNRWINLKAAFKASKLTRETGGLRGAVEAAGVRWQGRAHSGLDDATNTARLLIALVQKGAILKITGSFKIYGPDGSQVKKSLLTKRRSEPLGDANKARAVGAKGSESRLGAREGGSSHLQTDTCYCGVKSKLRTVKKPGSALGKSFYSCGKWTITSGGACNFFLWAPDL